MVSHDEKWVRHLKLLYGIALSFIAITILSSSLMLQFAIQSNNGDSRVINLSGRQRMLSQRLTKCVLAVERLPEGEDRNARLKEISESLPSWKAAHLGLQHGDVKLGLPARKNSKEIVAMFAEMEPFHVAMVRALDNLLVNNGPLDPAFVVSTADVMLRNEANFLKLMDKITFQFDKEAKERVGSMRIMEWIILCVGLLVLLLEFLFVFRPSVGQIERMINSLKQQVNEIKKGNEKLLESERQLSALNQQLQANEQALIVAKSGLEQRIKERTKELEEANVFLENRVAERTGELQKKMEELARMNKFMSDRELRIIEVKKEVNKLCKELGRPNLYSL